MKIADYSLLNIGPTPKEIKRMRKATFDFQKVYGRPVIFKHRWNLDDVQKGLAKTCPFMDQSYHRSKTDCKYCFGTGFLGGFQDGIIIFATLTDTDIDQLQIGPEGNILFERHPELTAPWYPVIGDGDLIITAEFDRATWQVLKTLEVYELNDCRPTTIRGPFSTYTDYTLYNTQYTSQIDRVPNNHVYYNVPIEFNYENIPIVIPPPGAFASDYPINTYVSFGLRINGSEGGLLTAARQTINIVGDGTASNATIGFRMKGNVSPINTGVIFAS